FESSRPSQLFRKFQRSWEVFVLLLISSARLASIQLRDCVDRDLGIARQIVRGQNRLHVRGLVSRVAMSVDPRPIARVLNRKSIQWDRYPQLEAGPLPVIIDLPSKLTYDAAFS